MKVGEFYRSIYNHYVAKVVKVTRDNVTLENRQGVSETIALENFDLNWRRCANIYEYRDTIDEAFSHVQHSIVMYGNCVKVTVDTDYVEFSIVDDMLMIQVTDDVKDALDLEYNVADFLLEDALDVINTIANLFE